MEGCGTLMQSASIFSIAPLSQPQSGRRLPLRGGQVRPQAHHQPGTYGFPLCDQRLHITASRLAVPCTHSQLFQGKQAVGHARRLLSHAVICSAALNARCSEGQTQTVQRQSSAITIAPIQGKEKSPDLDDGGTGFPPRDDDGGGGGGGGGGPNWSGGFFFFGLLAFLGFLKDQESEGPYRNNRRR